MGHHHDHEGHHHHHSSKNVAFAFFINLIFTVIEILGGLYTNSVAILSDALHDLGDSFSLGLAWYLQKYAAKGSDQNFSYGYKRYTVLGALINSIILIGGSVFIIIEAIKRMSAPEDVDAKGMIIFAILGVVFNLIAYYRLHGSHDLNEKVVSLHLLEDVLGWVAVLIGSIIMYFFDFPIIDPILSVLISVFILYNVIRNLNQSVNIIMQGKPANIDLKHIEAQMVSLPQIDSAHDLHIWSMDGNYNVLTAHLVIDNNLNLLELKDLKTQIKRTLKGLNIHHATIEFESLDEVCEHVKP